jgi:hypothetical protein
MRIDDTGDISFYEDTGTTAKFFWDSSAERLGLGTTSPTAPLHIERTGSVGIQITSTNSSDTYINFGDSADTNAGLITYEHDNNAFAFRTNGSERLRIDSSGNLLVGTTDDVVWNNSANSAADNGHNLRDDGRAGFAFYSATANANATVNINRTGSDGDLIRLFKSGTKVGSIRSEGGDIVFGNDTRGLKFRDSDVIPRDMDNTTADGVVSLGSSTSRFKDLYLSGFTRYNTEVYVGDGASISGSYAANDLLLHTDNNPIVFRPNGTEAVRIDASGNVGIGTSSPNAIADLHVADNSDARIWLDATSADTMELYSGTGVGMFNRSNSHLILGTNNTERMRIDSSGNVGIGASSPSNQLHLQKSADTGIVIENSASSNATLSLLATGAGRVRSSGTLIFDTGGATERMRIDSSGKVGIGDSTPTARLDIGGMAAGEVGLQITSPRNDAISTGLAYINVTDSVAPFSALTIDHNGTGKLIEFRDGGTLSGVIFKKADQLCIGVHDTNIRFLDSSDSIIPVHSGGDGRNDSISLGTNGARFKNGYFSGSLYGDGSNLTGVGGSTTRGDVGTYTVGATSNSNSTAIAAGATAAGNTLVTDYYSFYHQRPLATDFNGSTSCGLSGTWRNMGGTATGAQFGVKSPTLWVRIS